MIIPKEERELGLSVSLGAPRRGLFFFSFFFVRTAQQQAGAAARNCTSIYYYYLFCCHFYVPAQPVGFTLSDLLDKPWSQVSSLLSPGIFHFYRA